jgi:hypothetical protein
VAAIGPFIIGVPDTVYLKIRMEMTPSIEYLVEQCRKFRLGISDLNPLWDMVEPIMEGVETAQFEGAGNWAPLAESTLARKEAGGWPSDPLVRTGDLKESLVNPGAAVDRGPMHFSYGSDIPYSGLHQTGTRNMPARQVIPDPFRVEDRRKVEGAMVAYINGLSRETFGGIKPGVGGVTSVAWDIPISLKPWKELYAAEWIIRNAEEFK